MTKTRHDAKNAAIEYPASCGAFKQRLKGLGVGLFATIFLDVSIGTGILYFLTLYTFHKHSHDITKQSGKFTKVTDIPRTFFQPNF